MDCRNTRRALPDLIDEDLSRTRAEEVQRHLASCVECTIEWKSLRDVMRLGEESVAYQGASLSFDALRARMAAIDPLEDVLRYRLPKLKIPGTLPRYATAMVLLAILAGLPYACRNSRQVYTAVKFPFESHEATLVAALEEGRFPGDPEPHPDEAAPAPRVEKRI